MIQRITVLLILLISLALKYCFNNSKRGLLDGSKSPVHMDLKASHIPMTGSEAPLFKESISKSTYVKFPIEGHQDLKDKAKYLRGSHFGLGDDGFQGIPEYKAAYVEKGFIPNGMNEAHVKEIRSSHLSYMFSPKYSSNLIKSTYQDRICDPSKGSIPQTERVHHNLQKTSFIMGSEGPRFTTEMKAKYVNYGPTQRESKDFMKPHNTGSDMGMSNDKLDYTTEARAQFTGLIPNLKELDTAKEFSKYLRKEHFKLGTEPKDMTTHYHLHFNERVKAGESAKLNVQQLNDVKRSHFYLGDKGDIGITHYIDQHRWLQPVPKELIQSS